MFSIYISDTEYKTVEKLIEENPIRAARYGTNGSLLDQTLGMVGERQIQRFLDCNVSIPDGCGYDGGYDLTYKKLLIDAKTMGRTTSNLYPNYVSVVFSGVHHHDCDVYIFNSFNKKNNILTVCGWLPQYLFMEKSTFKTKGTLAPFGKDGERPLLYDSYFILISEMKNVKSLEHLKMNLTRYSKLKFGE